MRTPSFTLAAIGLFVLGCDQSTSTSPSASSPSFTPVDGGANVSDNTIVNRVSASGSDIDAIAPGGDANFSLTALVRADGSVSGQWADEFGHGNGGFHAVIDCVNIVGNQAWVSGIVTSGTAGGTDLTGLPVGTRVADNGTSANDPPDQISFSFLGDPTPCTAAPPYPLLTKTKGQVTVE